ncbi:hypothetical protein KAR91_49530 [Candidatus Pacearchaeota archaeon]|nr:hypothetical protein [Candidatus Pacearchaeota archaeon]
MGIETIHVVIGLNAVAWVFSAGVVWTKLRNLEDIVKNGLSGKVDKQGLKIAALEAKVGN